MANVEIVVEPGCDVVAVAEDLADLIGGRLDRIDVDGRAYDVVEPGLELADEPGSRGGPRHHYRIVLILPPRRLALRRERADHGELRVVDPHALAEWNVAAEELVGDGGADHEHGRGMR